jgi:hypothetical protein
MTPDYLLTDLINFVNDALKKKITFTVGDWLEHLSNQELELLLAYSDAFSKGEDTPFPSIAIGVISAEAQFKMPNEKNEFKFSEEELGEMFSALALFANLELIRRFDPNFSLRTPFSIFDEDIELMASAIERLKKDSLKFH